MTNWCHNVLKISGDEAALQAFMEPVPHDRARDLKLLASHLPVPNGINRAEWREQSWGCDKGDVNTQLAEQESGKLKFIFDSDNIPPAMGIEILSSRFPDLRFAISFVEPYGDIAGEMVFEGGELVQQDIRETGMREPIDQEVTATTEQETLFDVSAVVGPAAAVGEAVIDAKGHDPAWDAMVTADTPPSDRTVAVSVDELREWYQAARDMDAPQDRLEGIALMGLNAKATWAAERKPLPINADDHAEMQQTVQDYGDFQMRGVVVRALAELMLANAGSTSLRQDPYVMSKGDEELVINKTTGSSDKTILHQIGNDMRCAAVTEEDSRWFEQQAASLMRMQQAETSLAF